MFRRIAIGLVLLLPQTAPAAVLVIANGTDSSITFSLDRGNTSADSVTLQKGESKPFQVGRRATVNFISAGSPSAFVLDAYNAYVFTKQKGAVTIKGIELLGKPVPLVDTPVRLSAEAAPYTVKLKFYADDANPFVRSGWEPILKRRVEKATSILSEATGVKFEIVDAGIWKSDPDADTLSKLFTEFEEKVKLENGIVHIGFSHRLPARPNDQIATSLGKTLAPLGSHILIREAAVRSESEQVELLTHELGHWLGAVAALETDSVMRSKLGDGRAVLSSFRIRFDPLNILAMNLWAAELATGKVKTWQDLKPETQARLARIYETLAKADPAEKQSEAITALIAAQIPEAAAVANPAPKPNVNAPARPKNTKEEAVRRVLRGLTIRAIDNASKPAGMQLKGDELTVMLMKTAADIALSEEETMQVPAFAVAIGIGLDDSTILRNNPLTKALYSAVESNDEFDSRAKAIIGATLHGRRDSCQHFVVSCGLTDLIGPELAKQAGLAKELQDMKGTSGFSFCDLCVDYGGVEFIERLKKDKHLLSRVRQQFRVKDFVPSMNGLTEDHSAAQFKSKYGSISDPRFKAVVAEIEKRVKSLGGYAR